MIKERYCSYEVARLLKEKGFDEVCTCLYYNGDWEFVNDNAYEHVIRNSSIVNKDFITAPTHQMACDWLREVHHICITIYPDKEKGFEAVLYDIESDVEITLQSFGIYDFHIFGNSYEEAVEAALKYSLENLV